MNKRQKEILQSQLDNEERTLKELKQIYEQALKDCETKIAELSSRRDMENLQSIIYQKQYQQALKGQLEGVLEQLHSNEYATVSDYLARCYEDGYIGVMYDLHGQGIPVIIPIDQEQVIQAIQTDSKLSKPLYDRLGEDINKLKRSVRAEVSRGIANGSTWNEIAGKLAMGFKSTPFNSAYNRAMTIAQTEGHRIQIQSADHAQHSAKEKGANVVKQWDATLDDKTRDSHRIVDGEIRELDEKFSNGLMYPGDPSGDAAEVVNCRCALLQRAKWALDDAELDTLKERADYFGLDKTKNFKDFKEKYLNVSERVREGAQMMNSKDILENIGDSSTIKSKWDNGLQPRGQLPHIDEDDLYSYVADELKISEDKATEYTDSVMGFTDELFTDVRKYQRGETAISIDIDDAKSISDSIEEYIQVAPRWNGGTTYRGVSVSDAELASYTEGHIIKGMGGTASWSAKKEQASGFAVRTVTYERPNSIIYHCDTQSKGTGISHLAVFEHESEVLCSKESDYRVLKTEKDEDNIVHVFLKEVIE